MNCLSALFCLLFLAMLTIDAQARILPGMSLNKDVIIVNVGGMTSSLLPPSSTISSPQTFKEIRRSSSSSSSIFQIMFDIIGWIMSSAPAPKAASAAERQQHVDQISSRDDETSSPCDKLIIPSITSSSLFFPPTPPAIGTVPSPQPKVHGRSPPPPTPSSTSSLNGSPIPAIPSKPMSVHPPPPIKPSSTSLNASPIPAIPSKSMSEHPPPIRPSSKNNDQLENQMINGITTTPSNSVISMITHPQDDPPQVS